MASAEVKCSFCGKEKGVVALKRCMRCKQASYCGAECQKAAWGLHKKTCKEALRVPALALWNASVHGRIEEVQQLLVDGANVEERGGERGCRPLHAAAQGGFCSTPNPQQ